jgi:hypothetical protein
MGAHHGVRHRKYNRCYIIRLITLPVCWKVVVFIYLNGYKWITNCFNGFKDATALMQSGKAYENLSDGLKLLYGMDYIANHRILSFCC